MNLVPPVFRPPSEAFSLIMQLTLGCRHNACTFCGMYKGKSFRVKKWEEIKNDIIQCSIQMAGTSRVFLADGDALAAPTSLILKTVLLLKDKFPALERVSMYAGPKDILGKSIEELKEIRSSGVRLLYMGLESGNDDILTSIRKGVSASEMIEAGNKALHSGFELSITVINGLGGTKYWEKHAHDTGRVLSAIDPTYLGALTLMLVPNTQLHQMALNGEFVLPDATEILREIKLMLESLNISNCVFRTNHASNYLPLRGVLNKDKEKILNVLNKAITSPESVPLRPEFRRGL